MLRGSVVPRAMGPGFPAGQRPEGWADWLGLIACRDTGPGLYNAGTNSGSG
jgi:hypothetical protein